MTDLIERLRIYAGQNYDSSVSFDASELCHEAADEVGRLRAALAQSIGTVRELMAEWGFNRERVES